LLDALIDWEIGLGAGDTDHRVLLVGHATTNRVLLAVALEVPLRDFRRRFQQDWVNLTVLRYGARPDAGPMLLLANDVSHLYGVMGATWDL
jgi:broad specificity phosphatase PhoE